MASILGIGGNVISTTGPPNDPVPFNGRKFPTFFRIVKEPKGGLSSHARSIARYASNSKPMRTMTILTGPTVQARSSLTRRICVSVPISGMASSPRSFRCPMTQRVGDMVNMTVTVTDIERDTKDQPFVSHFTMKGSTEAEDVPPPPPGQRVRRHKAQRKRKTFFAGALPLRISVKFDGRNGTILNFNSTNTAPSRS